MSCLCTCTHPFLNLLERLLARPDPRPHLGRIAELLDGLCDPEDDDSVRWRNDRVYALIDKLANLDTFDGVVWPEIPVTFPRRDGTGTALVPQVEFVTVQLGLRGATATKVVKVYRELRRHAVAAGEVQVDV